MNEMLKIPVMLAMTFRDKVRFLLLLTLLNTTWIAYFVVHSSQHVWFWLTALSFIYLPLIIHQSMVYYYLIMILKLPARNNTVASEIPLSQEGAYYQSADSIHEFNAKSWRMGQGFEALGAFSQMYGQSGDLAEIISPVSKVILLANPLFIILTVLLMFITTLISIFTLIAYL